MNESIKLRLQKRAGIFHPGQRTCPLCGRDKSAHQTAHRTIATASPIQCKCGNPKPPMERRCQKCQFEWQQAKAARLALEGYEY